MPLFGNKTFEDPELGTLTRSGRRWWAALALPHHAAAEVGICGTRVAPDAEGLALARELPGRYAALRPSIQQALFEHCEPYLEASGAGDPPVEMPSIAAAADVWPHVELEVVRIDPLEEGLTIEIVYTTDWDVEHALGARILGWRLVELCGSVGP